MVKPTRVISLAQKAYASDNTKLQALILKGIALFKFKRHPDSLDHYKEAVRLMPFCFEGYKGVVDGYLATNRLSDASKMMIYLVWFRIFFALSSNKNILIYVFLC